MFPNLAELFDLHLEYARQLNSARALQHRALDQRMSRKLTSVDEEVSRQFDEDADPGQALTLSDFAVWWQSLDPATRALLESNYRKGYARVVEEAEQRLAVKHYAQQAR